MSVWRGVLGVAVALAAAGCGDSAPPPEQAGAPSAAPPAQEPPVAVNPDSPIQYPPRLYDQKVEGDVVLRLFTDSTGQLVPESSKVAESSGYPALDSAALAGAKKLRFAPARRRGVAVATAFLQPIEFRHPQAGASVIRGRPDTVRAAPAPAPAPPHRDRPGTAGYVSPHPAARHDQGAAGDDRRTAGHDHGTARHRREGGHQWRRTLSRTPPSSRRSAGRP